VSDAGAASLSPAEQTAVHWRAAETLAATASIRADRADAALLHALVGKASSVLVKLALTVIGTSYKDLASLTRWFTMLRMVRTDRLIYPDDPNVSRLLRIAQALLEAESEDRSRLQEVMETLWREIAEEPDPAPREALEYMALAKLLLCRGLAAAGVDWVALVARFDALTDADPEKRHLMDEFQGRRPEAPGVVGFLFFNLGLGVRGVPQQLAAFEALHRLSPEVRGRLLFGLQEQPADIGLLVNHGWLAEHETGELDPPAAERAYARMAVLARGLGRGGAGGALPHRARNLAGRIRRG
jgi:hypothetical protein